MRGGLGNCVSMLLETLIACQRWGCVPSTLSVLQIAHGSLLPVDLLSLAYRVCADHGLLGAKVLQGVKT